MPLLASRFGLVRSAPTGRRARLESTRVHGLFGFGKSRDQVAQEREEEFQAQQAALKKRRTGDSLREADVRRAEVTKVIKAKKAEKQVEREMLAKGLMPESLAKWKPYDDKTEENSRTGIVVPLLPFGIQKYDEGERFDLRNPFSETGYVDPDELTPWDSLKRFGRKVFDFSDGKMIEEDAKKEIYVPDIKKVGKGYKKGKK